MLLILSAIDRWRVMLYTSGPVSLKERLSYFLNTLFVKQVKSFYLLLDLDPFMFTSQHESTSSSQVYKIFH